jgi:Fic family protein
MFASKGIKITPSLLIKICEIDEFKGFWTGLETHSTGLRVLREVAEYGGNFKQVLGPLKGRPLDAPTLCALYGALTKEKPVFKSIDNNLPVMRGQDVVGVLETVPAEQTPELMAKLMTWLDDTLRDREVHPLLSIAMFAAVFLQIAPFASDNFKMARFLITLLMLKSGYSYAAYIPLERIMSERAEIVYQALQINQQSLEQSAPDWSAWLDCFLSILLDQKNTLKSRLYEKEKDVSHLPSLSGKILKLFEHHNRLQMKQIVKLTNGRRSTIKLRLGEMVDQGYVKRYGTARATWYSLV